MPYKLSRRGSGYKVTTPSHPNGFSKKPLSKKKARKQLAAIKMHSHESVERTIRLIGDLTEKRGETLVIVDIQPEYLDSFSHINLKALRTSARSYSEVVCFFNSASEGLTLDQREDVQELLGITGNVRWVDKGYAFFRDLMDNGVDPDDLVELITTMRRRGVRDWRELDPDEGIVRKIGRDPEELAFYLPEFLGTLENLHGKIVLVGGGEYECLAEIALMLRALGKSFTIDRRFVY